MLTQAPVAANAAQLADIQKKLLLDNRIRGGIGWFYWIAGLTLVNSTAYLFGINFTFVIGLGVTQIIDAVMSMAAKNLGGSWSLLRVAAMAIDVCIAGVFVLFGYFGRKGVRWPIVVGLALYALDGVMALVLKVYVAAAFHLLALIGIWGGLQAIRQMQALETSTTGEPIESLRQRSAGLVQPQVTPQQNRLRWILSALILLVVAAAFAMIALQR